MSPYLERPLRSLAEVLSERRRNIAIEAERRKVVPFPRRPVSGPASGLHSGTRLPSPPRM